MNILKFIGVYIWNILQSIGAIPWVIVTQWFRRLFLLSYHLLSGPVFFVQGSIYGIGLLFSDSGKFSGWFGKSALNLLVWIGRVVSKALDVIMLGEILDLLFQIIKPNSRTLTELEIAEAEKVFGSGISYWQVRIDERSLLARWGAMYAKSAQMGVTTFHTINFTQKIHPKPGNADMIWLIHELAHVYQMNHAGIQYIVEALVAQNTGGYQYGGVKALVGKKLADFNREQQAEIAADYYSKVIYGHTSNDFFIHLIMEYRNPNRLIY